MELAGASSNLPWMCSMGNTVHTYMLFYWNVIDQCITPPPIHFACVTPPQVFRGRNGKDAAQRSRLSLCVSPPAKNARDRLAKTPKKQIINNVYIL